MTTVIVFDRTLLDNLLISKQYREALEYTDSLDLKKNASLSRDDLARLYFAQGQCLYRLGQLRQGIIKLKCSMKLSEPLNDNLLYARQKYTLGQMHRMMGRIDEAQTEFTEAQAFFRRLFLHDRMLSALQETALIHFQKGDYQRAVEVNESVMRQARTYRIPQSFRTATINLCRVLMLTGNLKRVGKLLDSITDDCTDSLSRTWLESLRGMLSVRLLDDAGAKEHLGNAIALAKECHYRRDEVVCLEYLALNDFYHGRHAEAICNCEQILNTLEVTPSAVAQTLWLLTEVYIAENKLTLAAETGAKAEQAIIHVKEWAELGCLHRALAFLADKRGDLPGTIDHFGKAIEILSRHGARYELAVTYMAAGAAGCFDTETRKERLQQAKTLFTEMEVPKRVEQVETALTCMTAVKPLHKGVRSDKSGIETPDIITQNSEMQRILSDAELFAQTDMTILITGETGTGKDLLAKYIHCHSRRASGPFCNENMSRFPRELVDSELFGYEKGSHSRAERNKAGVIELAEGGTFCLNEIVELPLDIQARLLQVIEDGTLRRVGGGIPRPVDVRFIAMTNGDLEKRVEAQLFRQDLYYRLQDFHLHLPPLRERLEDLPLLVQHFLRQLNFADYHLNQSTLIVEQCGIERYDWPGNVRELRGLLKKAATLSTSRLLAELVGHLKIRMAQMLMIDSDSAERAKLVAVLEQNDGNKSAAARELGIPLTTLCSRLKRLDFS